MLHGFEGGMRFVSRTPRLRMPPHPFFHGPPLPPPFWSYLPVRRQRGFRKFVALSPGHFFVLFTLFVVLFYRSPSYYVSYLWQFREVLVKHVFGKERVPRAEVSHVPESQVPLQMHGGGAGGGVRSVPAFCLAGLRRFERFTTHRAKTRGQGRRFVWWLSLRDEPGLAFSGDGKRKRFPGFVFLLQGGLCCCWRVSIGWRATHGPGLNATKHRQRAGEGW